MAAILFATGLWTRQHAEPLLRASLIQALQERFRARVEMDAFHLAVHSSLLTGSTAVVQIDGLRIWLPEANPEELQEDPAHTVGLQPRWFLQPWITVRHLQFTATLSVLGRRELHLKDVQVTGVRLLVPPKGYRPRLTTMQSASRKRWAISHLPDMRVDQIRCQDVFLEMERDPKTNSDARAAGKPPAGKALPVATRPQAATAPLQFQIASLILHPEGHEEPIRFQLQMRNPRPVGTIEATGELGPWRMPDPGRKFDPGALPLQGSYRFRNADLATLRGIAGRLNSEGSFDGILRRVRVRGQSQTPDFRLTRHGVIPPATVGLPLWTRFSATVDGTNGNTVLNAVEATLGHTHLWARGQILRVQYLRLQPGGSPVSRIGHDVRLAVRVDRGQIADLLHVATANPSPLMTGSVTLTNTLDLPPGMESFRQRLALQGTLDATNVRFTSDRIERDLAQLSLRGQGHPEALKQGTQQTVTSTLSGDFTLAGGVLDLPRLVYQVPGAQIHLHGSYTLVDGALDLSGDAQLQASLSHLIGGWKGALLSPMNRVFAKNGAGTDVPIRLSGTSAAPHLGIDLSRIGKSSPATGP